MKHAKNNGVKTTWLIKLSKEAWVKWHGYVNTTQLGLDEDETDMLYIGFRDLNGDEYTAKIHVDKKVEIFVDSRFGDEQIREYFSTIMLDDFLKYLNSLPQTALSYFTAKSIDK